MPRYAGRESQKSVGSWSYSLSFYPYILRVDLLGGNFEGLFGCGYDPLVGWVVMEVPNAFRTCPDVEIVGFVSVAGQPLDGNPEARGRHRGSRRCRACGEDSSKSFRLES
jgi:hypothetical protein